MKPSMIRWNTVPSYRRSVVFARVAGWVHSRRPSARSAKLATVFGAWSGKRSTVMSPWLVCRTARRAGVDSVTRPVSHGSLARLPARDAPSHVHELPYVEVAEAGLTLGRLLHPLGELAGERVFRVAHRRGVVGEGDQFQVGVGAVVVGGDDGPACGRL